MPHRDPPASPKAKKTPAVLEGVPNPDDVRLSYINKAAGVTVYKLKNNKKVFVPLKG